MIVYRVIKSEKSIFNNFSLGNNSFVYENGKRYLHFFILPENAEMFQCLKFGKEQSVVLRCDIPAYVLQNNFGIGMYRISKNKPAVPFLEVRLNIVDFKHSYIVEKSNVVKENWKNKFVFDNYCEECINKCEVFPDVMIGNEKLRINPTFNFWKYFPEQDLEENSNEID